VDLKPKIVKRDKEGNYMLIKGTIHQEDIIKLDVVAHMYNPSYSRGTGRKMMSLRLAQAKLARPYIKNKIETKELGA
jgi:hypothetical protein